MNSEASENTNLRSLRDITPPQIAAMLKQGVKGQDEAVRYASVAMYKHVTGVVSGNMLLIGNSGSGKTTLMRNIQRVYNEVPEFRPFRAMTLINANLLVDMDHLEFRPDRVLIAAEQRARVLLGSQATPEDLKLFMDHSTIAVDEIDKMATVIAGTDKPNPAGIILQEGLLTMMEGDMVAYKTHAFVDGEDRELVIDVDTSHMMFIAGGAFEKLYEQVYHRVTAPNSGITIRNRLVTTIDGDVKLEPIFFLKDFLETGDIFSYGMTPQFMGRFDSTILLNPLNIEVLKQILYTAPDSPYLRSKRFFTTMNIELDIDDFAASLIAEAAQKDLRTGARAMRPIFANIITPYEFDPFSRPGLEPQGNGYRLLVTPDMVRRALIKENDVA